MYMWIYTHVINSGIFISDVVKCQRPYIDDLGSLRCLSSSSAVYCSGVRTVRCGLLTLRGRYKSLEPLDRGGVDGGVQVVPVSCCFDKERVPQLVCSAAWNYVGPIIASCSHR